MTPTQRMLRTLALIPVWLITLCIKPFLRADHPWKHQNLTLRWWCIGATTDALYVGVTLWVWLACVTAIAVRIVHIHTQP